MLNIQLTKEQQSILMVAMTVFYQEICKEPNPTTPEFKAKVMEISKLITDAEEME